MRNMCVFLFLLIPFALKAQKHIVSGLNIRQFHKYWKVESESSDYKVTFRGDTAEIISPKGLTLWRKEKMNGRVIIEYDACVVDEGRPGDRLSDLNCFWMASDPKYPEELWKREKWRNGVFLNCYSLQLYYMGYGGNYNTTTRFRRYDGNEAGITDANVRPSVLCEYTDSTNLLIPNHWYHIKITNENGRIRYYIDGKRLVDFQDAEPLTSGWFGFRTTLSRTRITNFSYKCLPVEDTAISLQWIGKTPPSDKAVSWGVPFGKGEVSPDNRPAVKNGNGQELPTDSWPLAYWPDGSVKWMGMASVIPGGTEKLILEKTSKKAVNKSGRMSVRSKTSDRKSNETSNKTSNKTSDRKSNEKLNEKSNGKLKIAETSTAFKVETGVITAYIPRHGTFLMDSLLYQGTKVGEKAYLVCSTQSEPLQESVTHLSLDHFVSEIKKVTLEQSGNVRALIKLEGVHRSTSGRELLPFVIRLYFYAGHEQIKMVHSFIFDGDQRCDFIRSLGIRFEVPMREELYNRHVAFSAVNGGVWSEPVQPLVGRRVLTLKKTADNDEHSDEVLARKEPLQQWQMEGKRIPSYETFDKKNRDLLDHWASWNSYRLTQLNDVAFSIRKRANNDNPWIGTFSGSRAGGYAFAGDVSGGLGVYLHDFWQSYPSSLEIEHACKATASLTVWLWSPESEPMDLRHYDNVAHDLNASYEDVQEGLSTPYGIARTSVLTLIPQDAYPGKEGIAVQTRNLSVPGQLVCSPEYLQRQHAFGIWSLPDRSTLLRADIEDRLEALIDYYRNSVEQHKWYGFWNYGDFMHAYDPVRHEWKYDVGGFAWDNTELASNMWLWYSFLRTGKEDSWRMAEAMTRHTGEVDVYHIGSNSPLGSRHNVSHWGCGAKEARISQAAWNRFYHYLTTDERCGDLMHEVKDADQKLYTLDPMRLAEPLEQYPCKAPARLRIGPDWLAYAGNWLTEWERTGNIIYRDKIIAGMKSISGLPHGLFTGNKALGFDPATGIVSYDGDPELQNTNHLMTIMGGFEVMNEMMEMIELPEWQAVWLDHAVRYKQQAATISNNHFRVSRLLAYAAWKLRRPDLAKEAWSDLLSGKQKKGRLMPFRIKKILPPEVLTGIDENPSVSTNDAATWALDAIYMLEVCPPVD